MTVPVSAAKRRPTVRDVAEAAGVSRGTVSRVINGGHWVSPEAQAAVEAAIRTTGYTANPHARSLATGRSNSVAFLLTEPHHLLFENPIFALMLRGATAAAAAHNIQMVLLLAESAAEQQRVVDYVASGHVDGVLLIGTQPGSTMLDKLLSHKVPTVALGTPLGYEGVVSSVATDDRLGGRQATEYLLSLGRRRIATITGPPDTPGGELRLQGYREALGDLYDPSLVLHGDWKRPSGYDGIADLLDRHRDLDAVFVHNDIMATGVVAKLHERGIAIPDDVAVIGFDDSGIVEQIQPLLTTMRQPYDRLSTEMLRLMLAAIDGEPPLAVALPAELILRESA